MLLQPRIAKPVSADFCGFAVSMTSIQCCNIGFGQHRILRELLIEPRDNRRAIPVEHPQREAKRPHILTAQRFFVAKPKWFDRIKRELRNIEVHHLPF